MRSPSPSEEEPALAARSPPCSVKAMTAFIPSLLNQSTHLRRSSSPSASLARTKFENRLRSVISIPSTIWLISLPHRPSIGVPFLCAALPHPIACRYVQLRETPLSSVANQPAAISPSSPGVIDCRGSVRARKYLGCAPRFRTSGNTPLRQSQAGRRSGRRRCQTLLSRHSALVGFET